MYVDYRRFYNEFYDDYYMKCFDINLWDSEISIHHMDYNRENNDLSNLVALPRSLHLKYHAAKRELDKYNIVIPDRLTEKSYLYRGLDVAMRYIPLWEECQVWVEMKEWSAWYCNNESKILKSRNGRDLLKQMLEKSNEQKSKYLRKE